MQCLELYTACVLSQYQWDKAFHAFCRKISLSLQNNHWLSQTWSSLLKFSVQYSERGYVLWNISAVCGPHHHDPQIIYLFFFFLKWSSIPDSPSPILDPDFPVNLEVLLIAIILFFSTTEEITCSKVINAFKRENLWTDPFRTSSIWDFYVLQEGLQVECVIVKYKATGINTSVTHT